MAHLTLTHHDHHSLISALVEYEANDGHFYVQSNSVTSNWMHLKADMDIVIDLISQPVTKHRRNSITIKDGIKVDDGVEITSTATLIITNDTFEAMQYSCAMPHLKHVLVKAKRKSPPKSNVIIVPKHLVSSILEWLTFYRIIFPFDYPNRTEVFKKSKFSYSITSFCIIYDWQLYQTFTFIQTFIKPDITFVKCKEYERFRKTHVINTDVFFCPCCQIHQKKILRLECGHNICKRCVNYMRNCFVCAKYILKLFVESCSKNDTHYPSIQQYMDLITWSSYIVFDDRCNNDFRKEYIKYQQGLVPVIRVSQLDIPPCHTKAFNQVVIINSISAPQISFIKSLRNICNKKQLKIQVIYTEKPMLYQYQLLNI